MFPAGNTGIGLGLLGNSLGYKTIIVMNDNQTQEKKDLLRNLGAELRLVPPKPYKDDNNFVKVAARLADELRPTNNNGVIWANQFDNKANAKGHYEGTGQEIWEQTEGKVDGHQLYPQFVPKFLVLSLRNDLWHLLYYQTG